MGMPSFNAEGKVFKPARVAATVMVTTACSAGCSECPFSRADMPRRHLSEEAFVRHLARLTDPLVVLSGGEPLEHPHLKALLWAAEQRGIPFRLATGGFLSLEEIVADLKRMRAFQGVSLGTDVLSSSYRRDHLADVWRSNVAMLSAEGVHYSLTVTSLHPADNWEGKLRKAAQLGADPEFVYLRYGGAGKLRDLLAAAWEAFPKIPVYLDDMV